MSELLSCPFCGGEAEWAKGKNGDGTDWDYIVCSMCEAIGPSASVQLEGKALDWNQRQPHPDTKRLDYFEQAGWSISVSAPTLREAIDKAMEQEK